MKKRKYRETLCALIIIAMLSTSCGKKQAVIQSNLKTETVVAVKETDANLPVPFDRTLHPAIYPEFGQSNYISYLYLAQMAGFIATFLLVYYSWDKIGDWYREYKWNKEKERYDKLLGRKEGTELRGSIPKTPPPTSETASAESESSSRQLSLSGSMGEFNIAPRQRRERHAEEESSGHSFVDEAHGPVSIRRTQSTGDLRDIPVRSHRIRLDERDIPIPPLLDTGNRYQFEEDVSDVIPPFIENAWNGLFSRPNIELRGSIPKPVQPEPVPPVFENLAVDDVPLPPEEVVFPDPLNFFLENVEEEEQGGSFDGLSIGGKTETPVIVNEHKSMPQLPPFTNTVKAESETWEPKDPKEVKDE